MTALAAQEQERKDHRDGGLDRERYEQGWSNLIAASPVHAHEYLTYHKERFYESFDNLAFYLQGNPSPRVLEIGVSPFTKLYKLFFPHIHLVTVERPADLYGLDATFTLDECGADSHYAIDLNRTAIGPQVGELSLGTFDYVIFTEIVEHLIVNPIQLFGELLSLLAPTGLLYVTTPNFFSQFHLQQLARWENPQWIFPKRGEDHDAGFHFREYTLVELIDFFEQAGGQIVKAHFSDCWDSPTVRGQIARSPQLRSQLVVVVCGKDAEIPRQSDSAQIRELAIPTDLDSVPKSLFQLQVENEQLRRIIQGYESGRFMRLMIWLHKRGLPHV